MYDNNMKGLAIAILLFFLASLAPAQDLPDGKGKEVLNRVCGSCHEAGVVSKYRDSKDDWVNIVEDMKSRGADGSDDDFQAIITYLTHFFGPEINVNKASSQELAAQLEITEKEADAIVKYRQDQGTFKAVDDLKKVPGLDIQKIQPIQQRIVF